MRAPRHRFSDNVRSITRSIATVMVEEGAIAQTPHELDTWISQRPRIRVPLEEGGYNKAFGADDLFPLLKAMVSQPAAPASEASTPSRMPKSALFAGGALLVAIVLGVIIGLLA